MIPFVSFLALSAVIGISNTLQCNPIACVYYLNNFFLDTEGSTSCMKFAKIEECINSCSQWMENGEFVKGMESLKEQMCSQQNYRHSNEFTETECLQYGKYHMLSCVFGSWNLETTSNDSNLNTCRKVTEVENCPSKTLKRCNYEVVSSVVDDMVLPALKDLKEKSCSGYSSNNVWSLQTTNKYKDNDEVAECFDKYHETVSSCFPKKWTFDPIVYPSNHSDMCILFERFLNCLNDSVVVKCGDNVLSAFHQIKLQAIQAFVPYCMANDMLEGKLYQNKSSVAIPYLKNIEVMASNISLNQSNQDELVDAHGSTEGIVIHYWSVSYNMAGMHHFSVSVFYFMLFYLFLGCFYSDHR